MHLKWLAGLCAAVLLAGCGGGNLNSALPVTGSADRAENLRSHREGKIVFHISIPKKRVHRRRHAHFISPSTQSMKLLITNTNPATDITEIANLTPTSTGCTSTLTTTLCVLTVTLAPGSNYVTSVSTYDQTGANGNALSTAQNVSFNVIAGQANTINMTLSGIPSQLLVLPGSAASNTNIQGGIDLVGTGRNKLLVEALDADGNFILGPGSPTFTVAQTVGTMNVTLTQPATTSPNTFYVQPPAAYTSGTATIGVTASYVGQVTDGCAQAGAVCTGSTVVDMQQVMGVANATTVNVFELGSLTSIATITAPGAINDMIFDASGDVFVSNCGTHCASTGNDAVLEYKPPYTGTPVSITSGVEHPQGIAFDSNGNLYVANDVVLDGGGQDTVTKYAPPFTAASAPTMSYTNTVNQPEALAISPANDLFVSELTGNSGNGQVIGFSSSYSSGPPNYGPITSGVSLQSSGVHSIAVDASANLYVVSPTTHQFTKYFGYNSVSGGQQPYTCSTTCGNGISSNPKTVTNCNGCANFTPIAIITFPTSGNAPQGYGLMVADSADNDVFQYSNSSGTPGYSRTISSHVSKPLSLLFDASTNLYVANNTGNSVTQYNSGAYGFAATLLSSFTGPNHIALVP